MADSYSNIAKNNIIFGGVKVLQVIVNILKTKVVALLLGPSGVGIQTLLISTVTTIFQFTNCGIAQSSVREISINDAVEIRSKIIQTINRIAFILGIVATLLCFIFSSILSEIVFGHEGFAWMFKVVSIALLFESVSASQTAILQGIRAIKSLAVSSLIGSILVLIASIPIYYLYGEDAIPLVVAMGFGLPAIVYLIYRRNYFKDSIRRRGFNKAHAKSILALGITLMAGNGIMALFSLSLNTFINLNGSSVDVGYYQAASTCTYSAINILVAILASDFFPRLSGSINNEKSAWEITNAQIDLFFLILGPVISVMVLFPGIFLRLLYSSEFLSVTDAVQIMGISLLFRIPWHCFSYIILAKGDKNKFLFIDAILGNGIFLASNLLGFYLYGITGIAISFVISSLLVCVILYITVNRSYGFKLNHTTLISGFSVLVAVSILFVFSYHNNNQSLKVISYIIAGVLMIISIVAVERKTRAISAILCKLRIK